MWIKKICYPQEEPPYHLMTCKLQRGMPGKKPFNSVTTIIIVTYDNLIDLSSKLPKVKDLTRDRDLKLS